MSRCLLFKAEFPGSASQSSGSLVIMAVSLVFPFMTYNLSPHTRIPAPQSLRYISSEKPRPKETWEAIRGLQGQKCRDSVNL